MILADPAAVREPTAAEVKALESRADVDSLDLLHAKRRALVEQLNPLKAMYGPFGLFDDRRKQMVEACKLRAYAALTAAGEKTPEWRVESEAYGDEQYQRLLDEAMGQRIQYLTLENAVKECEERIRSRELELTCYAAELRLQR